MLSAPYWYFSRAEILNEKTPFKPLPSKAQMERRSRIYFLPVIFCKILQRKRHLNILTIYFNCHFLLLLHTMYRKPILMAVRSKALVCSSFIADVVG